MSKIRVKLCYLVYPPGFYPQSCFCVLRSTTTMETSFGLCVKLKLWVCLLYQKMDMKFLEQFGFHVKEITFSNVSTYLYAPKDSSSLAVTRILFGLAMLFDIPDERGGSVMEQRWGNPLLCHFPLIPFIRAVAMPYMALVYLALWLGAVGITLGFRYRLSAWLFTICYWYLFLIEKSFWNNHSYLFGLVATLLACTDANCYWSLDVYLGNCKRKRTIPYWNYFILKYQFFILYFMAGMKKGTAEWLTGYSVPNLSAHWVFTPFKLFLTTEQTDYLIVHWFVFVFDLTVAMWMMWSKTRHVAMIFCALFHLMNSRLFRIGMFPWVCLATMPLFYPFDWPKTIALYAETQASKVKGGIYKYMYKYVHNNVLQKQTLPDVKHNEVDEVNENSNNNSVSSEKTETLGNGEHEEKDLEQKSNSEHCEHAQNLKDGRKKITIALIAFHIITQAFLPYSHFITKGYNNWTNGLYGYSWDMMVHTWNIESVVIKVIDNTNQEEFYIDPYVYAPNDRWTRHGDMVYQYAQCLKSKFGSDDFHFNISIYVDVWCSMNGRFTQRMFDAKVDLLKVSWSPFKPVSYLMPLLDEGLNWRTMLDDIRTDVYSWNNFSEVVFVADFPGYDQEKYLAPELKNISITILNGTVAYQPEFSKYLTAQSHRLTTGHRIKANPGTSHKIINIGKTPAFYMYTLVNSSAVLDVDASSFLSIDAPPPTPKLPIGQELLQRLGNMLRFASIVSINILKIFFRLKFCN